MRAPILNSLFFSKVATIITFLALIRCIAEPMRLQSLTNETLTYPQFIPFLIGALIAALGLLAMTIFHYFRLYKMIIGTCALVITGLLLVKWLS